MLNHFKRKLTKSGACGKRHADMSQLRCSVERLEERAMLSASFGGPAYGYGAPNFVMYSPPAPQRFNGSAAFASQQQQQRSMSYDSQMFYDAGEVGPMYRDLQSRTNMQSAFAPPARINEVGQLRSPESGWNQFGGPPHENAYASYTEPAHPPYVSYGAPEPIYTVFVYYIEYSTPIGQDKPPHNVSAPDAFPSTTALRLQGPSGGTGGLAGGVGDLHQPHTPTSANPYGTVSDPSARLNQNSNYGAGLSAVLANVGSTISDLPVVSQILLRDTTTSSVLNAIARDVAIQDFSPSLFQASATAAYDRVNVDAIGTEVAQAEPADGWIHPTDESILDAAAESSDTVARERAAVDAVLEKLQDVNTRLPAAAVQDINSENNLQTGTALDDLPAGEVDGGMVLLRATGDANTSGFDLTPVYAAHVGRFNIPAKMETSVGMFQAMDVALDDAPIVEAVQQTESPVQLKHETQLEDKLPTKREQSSTSKAATLIGATTLTGALVWINRNGSLITRSKSTAQKRRASRG
jgi:hypothetical protein